MNKKRRPLHTKEDLHNKLSELFKDKFGWNPRSEGAFAFSNETKANLFGNTYLFFPTGEYDFVYNEDIIDLTNFLYNYKNKNKNHTHEFLKDIVNEYKDDNLKLAIESGAEISFNCDGYIIISPRFIDFFLQYINTRSS